MSNDSLTMTEVEPEVITDASQPATLLRQVVPNDDARKIIAAFKLLLQYGLGAMMICQTCMAAKKSEVAVWGHREADGELCLQCGCTRREFTGITR